MLRARRFDETLIAHADLVTGVYHVSIGQEATAAALAAARVPGDLIMLNHRNHGALAALGSDLETMFREILGRDGGPQRGRAGSLHLADPTRGVLYTSAMVGGGVALAVGMALAKRRRAEPGIVFACFGDGALDEGAMHESLALARRWELPLLFICESNASGAPLTALATVHGAPPLAVDAADPEAIAAALARAAGELRAGSGPRFVEARTEPWPGNRAFLPQLPDGELDLDAPAPPWDPIPRERRRLEGAGFASADLVKLDRRIRAEAAAAFDRAAAAPPPAGIALEGVWSP